VRVFDGSAILLYPAENTAEAPPVPARQLTLRHLRRLAIHRTLFRPTTLKRAVHKFGFLQADPIRAPARAQDLTLRHRVKDYRAGDLERRYPTLEIEEDFFVNYGFMPSHIQSLMHPREPREAWSEARWKQAREVLQFVRERGTAHPRDVDAHFAHGKVRNWFGGSSNSTTQLLDAMHYRGMLRVAHREGGIRSYSIRNPTPPPPDPRAAHDALIDIVAAKYAPLPASSLGHLLSLLCRGVPQWRGDRQPALQRAKQRLSHIKVDGIDWYMPAGQRKRGLDAPVEERVRLLAPFDPVVWDRRRFELFWGWAYRFEAYTPERRRKLGYYALPLLWCDEIVGWGNVSSKGARLNVTLGYVAGRAPRGAGFRRELEAEIEHLRLFLRPRN
jgi:uncharacterized protein YcaQ